MKQIGYNAIYKLGIDGISKGIIVNQALSSPYNSNNPSALNLNILKSSLTGYESYFNGVSARTSGTVNIGSIKTINLYIKPQINNVDILQLSGSGKVSLSSSNLITTTGLTTPEIYVNYKRNGTILLNNWNNVSIITNTSFNTSAFIIGYSSTYFKGFIKDIRLASIIINALDYNIEDFDYGKSY